MCSFFFFARPTDPPSREGGRWETKHFMGMALLEYHKVAKTAKTPKRRYLHFEYFYIKTFIKSFIFRSSQ